MEYVIGWFVCGIIGGCLFWVMKYKSDDYVGEFDFTCALVSATMIVAGPVCLFLMLLASATLGIAKLLRTVRRDR